jgi:hypothetical protein
MNFGKVGAGLCTILTMIAVPAFADSHRATMAADGGTPGQGSAIFRIDDGTTPTCIDRNTDRVTFGMIKFVLTKESSWFSEDRTATLYLNVTIRGASDGTSQDPVSVAKTVKADLTSFDTNNLANIAYEDDIIEAIVLKNDKDKNVFTSMAVGVALIKQKGDSEATTVLKGLVNAANSISIPSNPYSAGFKLASTYVSSVLNPLVDAAQKDETVFGGQQITMRFSSSSTCGTGDQKTGTILVVYSVNDLTKPGTIDIGNVGAYCDIKVFNGQTFDAQVKAKSAASGCDDTSGYVTLQNPYVAFFVNSEVAALTVAGTGSTAARRAKALKEASLKRCETWGIARARCH